MFKRIKRVLSAAALIIVAGAPTAAYARFNLNPDPTVVSAPVRVAPAPHAHPATESASPSFQWGDAGIGAAGVIVLAGVGSGAAVIRQRRAHRPVTS